MTGLVRCSDCTTRGRRFIFTAPPVIFIAMQSYTIDKGLPL
jgi:hypothetical protein